MLVVEISKLINITLDCVGNFSSGSEQKKMPLFVDPSKIDHLMKVTFKTVPK